MQWHAKAEKGGGGGTTSDKDVRHQRIHGDCDSVHKHSKKATESDRPKMTNPAKDRSTTQIKLSQIISTDSQNTQTVNHSVVDLHFIGLENKKKKLVDT